jgi:outer membrane protein assembly factor BamB
MFTTVGIATFARDVGGFFFRPAWRLAPLACALALCTACPADWPQFQGPKRDGTSPETGLLRAWPPAGPGIAWSVAVGEGYGGAAIVDDEVYILDRKGDSTDALRCIALGDGAERWRLEYESAGGIGLDGARYPHTTSMAHSGSRTPPTVDNRHVYSVGLMGAFTCTVRETHEIAWQIELMQAFRMPFPICGFAQAPLLYKDLVILSVQAEDTCAVAFKKDSGEVAWKSPPLGLTGYVSPIIATLAGVEQLVVATASDKDARTKGAVAGISLADGAVLWRYEGWQCYVPIPTPTVLPGDLLFITGGYKSGSRIIQIQVDSAGLSARELVSLDARTCAAQVHPPLLYNGHLYLNSNANERQNGMTCIDLDGAVRWRTADTEGLPTFDRGGLILADGMLIALDGKSGTLFLVDPSPDGYRELARAKVLDGRELWAPLALSQGKLIVRSQNVMKCLDMKRMLN